MVCCKMSPLTHTGLRTTSLAFAPASPHVPRKMCVQLTVVTALYPQSLTGLGDRLDHTGCCLSRPVLGWWPSTIASFRSQLLPLCPSLRTYYFTEVQGHPIPQGRRGSTWPSQPVATPKHLWRDRMETCKILWHVRLGTTEWRRGM